MSYRELIGLISVLFVCAFAAQGIYGFLGCDTVESDELDQLELCLYPSAVDQVENEPRKLPNEVPETTVMNQYKSWVRIYSGTDLYNQDHHFEIDETCQITAGSPLEPVGKVDDMIWMRYLGPVGTEAHGSLCPAGTEFLMPEESFLETDHAVVQGRQIMQIGTICDVNQEYAVKYTWGYEGICLFYPGNQIRITETLDDYAVISYEQTDSLVQSLQCRHGAKIRLDYAELLEICTTPASF